MNIKLFISFVMIVSVGGLAIGCSTEIDAKYVGTYIDTRDPEGRIWISENGRAGMCHGACRDGYVTIDGATANFQLSSGMAPTDDGIHYPEFRGKNTTFVIDRNTIILATGTRFTKESR